MAINESYFNNLGNMMPTPSYTIPQTMVSSFAQPAAMSDFSSSFKLPDFTEISPEAYSSVFKTNVGTGITEDPSFMDRLTGDKAFGGNIAGLASALTQLVALPTALENARLTNRALRQDINTAKEEQARRNRNISSFNAFKG
jgi:hypothetical protein